MKKIYLLCGVLALFFVINSCRKVTSVDEQNSINSQTDESLLPKPGFVFSLGAAKKFLQADLYSQTPYIRVNSNDKNKPKLTGFLFWTRSRTYKKGIYEVVEIPMNLDSRAVSLYNLPKDKPKTAPDLSVAVASFSRLIVYRNYGTGEIDKRIVTYIPDKSYLATHNIDASKNWIDKFDKDFSGYLEYKTLNGTIESLVRVVKGMNVARYNIAVSEKTSGDLKAQSTTPPDKLKKLDYYCDTYFVVDYMQVCYTNGEGGTTCGEMREDGGHYETFCQEYANEYGNGNGTSYPPGPTSGGGGGGGNSGGGNEGAVSAHPYLTPIASPNLLPCAAKIVSDITDMAYSANVIANALNLYTPSVVGVPEMLGLIMNNPNYGITFDQGNNNAGVNASTTPTVPVKSSLNPNYLATASNLAVARTVIHETVHAYFVYGNNNLQNDPNFSNFQAINSLLFDTSGNQYVDQNSAQHNQIAASYINSLAYMLVNYANMKGIVNPDPSRTLYSYCEDLAWAGLYGTQAFINLSTQDQNRILATITKEEQFLPGSSTLKACP